MNKQQKMLIESMHPLVTPEFSGANEEILQAINYWMGVVTQFRLLTTDVTSFVNRASIIKQMEVELAALRSELENVSSVATKDEDGKLSMTQPKVEPDGEIIQPDNAVDLSVKEDMQRLAGIPVPSRNSLSNLFNRALK
jgi:hypothetical protein